MIKTSLPADILVIKRDFDIYGHHVLICGPSYLFPIYHFNILDTFLDRHNLEKFFSENDLRADAIIHIEGFLIDIECEDAMFLAEDCMKRFGNGSIYGCTLCKDDSGEDDIEGISGYKLRGKGSEIHKYIFRL